MSAELASSRCCCGRDGRRRMQLHQDGADGSPLSARRNCKALPLSGKRGSSSCQSRLLMRAPLCASAHRPPSHAPPSPCPPLPAPFMRPATETMDACGRRPAAPISIGNHADARGVIDTITLERVGESRYVNVVPQYWRLDTEFRLWLTVYTCVRVEEASDFNYVQCTPAPDTRSGHAEYVHACACMHDARDSTRTSLQ